MPRNWSREELAETLRRNPGLRVTAPQAPLERVKQTPAIAAQTPRANAAASTKPEMAGNQFPASTKPGNGLHELMACPSYQGTLQPEESLSVAVASELRRLTHQGGLRAVWSRLPLEHPEGGRYGMLAQVKRTAMGAVPGAPDFWFCWQQGAGLIELKTEASQGSLLAPSGKAGLRKGKRTYLRGRQRLFQAWAEMFHVKHAVCRSVGEVVAVLKQWGVLDG
jgi:hypothetical protein